ncbi:hypothetical protein [Sedimentitalea nanhaiensis]|uniref:Uncharacterized protein n=1 Tax=Sedimentitalea nanhaiensis TaxID=999627 RepID=A0A1I7B0V7_9RHOB|nr:hypothetical protein [Sedimentitalea nanhaiensis]SFT80813.1 hypothetical protein SAMN05216236_10867 [Sedimentitalea nanhaiensis]
MRAAILTLILTLAGPLRAQSLPDWEFRLTPYLWMAGLQGQVGTVPGLPPVDVDLSFSDILDDLEFGSMVMGSARNGPWVIYLDTTHVQLSTTEPLGGVMFDVAQSGPTPGVTFRF